MVKKNIYIYIVNTNRNYEWINLTCYIDFYVTNFQNAEINSNSFAKSILFRSGHLRSVPLTLFLSAEKSIVLSFLLDVSLGFHGYFATDPVLTSIDANYGMNAQIYFTPDSYLIIYFVLDENSDRL